METTNKELETLKEELEETKERIECLENNENEEEYRNFIDECNEEVTIFGMSYLPSRILEELDPIAFNCGHTDYNDNELNELNDKIRELEEEIKEAIENE